MFQWWNGNGGSKYNQFFNIFSVMASHDSKIIYNVCNLFGTLFTTLTRPQILFLTNRIFPLIKSFDKNNNYSYRFVTPRHIASDIRFSYIDGDKWFNDFIDNQKYSKGSFLYPYDETIPLTYTGNSKNFSRNVIGGKVGVYPAPDQKEYWQWLFQEWGSGEWKERGDGSHFKVPVFDESTAPIVSKNWFENCEKNHPDNFFARYGIAPNSPLVISFVNGSYQDPSQPGVVIDNNALKNLINGHSPSAPGGWVGYLEGMQSSSVSEDTYYNFIDSAYISVDPTKAVGAQNITSCDTATQVSNWTGAITSGLGIGGMAAFLGEAALGPLGLFFMFAGAATAITQGVATQSECNKKNKNASSTTPSPTNSFIKNRNRVYNNSKHKIMKTY